MIKQVNLKCLFRHEDEMIHQPNGVGKHSQMMCMTNASIDSYQAMMLCSGSRESMNKYNKMDCYICMCGSLNHQLFNHFPCLIM